MSVSDRDAPFVATVRSRPGILRVGPTDGPVITIRVQLAEAWDTVRVEVAPGVPVIDVKLAALAVLGAEPEYHQDYVLKLAGFEVLDENVSVRDAGLRDGSILLATHRRRIPVR
jgi:hypothetical protein